MNYFNGNITMIKLFGEGHYSGQTETHCAFVTTEFYEANKGVVDNYTPWFHELDGKHSEVEGDTTVTTLTNINAKSLLLESLGTEEYKIFECMFEEDDSGKVEIMEKLTAQIKDMTDTEMVVTLTFDGVVIN